MKYLKKFENNIEISSNSISYKFNENIFIKIKTIEDLDKLKIDGGWIGQTSLYEHLKYVILHYHKNNENVIYILCYNNTPKAAYYFKDGFHIERLYNEISRYPELKTTSRTVNSYIFELISNLLYTNADISKLKNDYKYQDILAQLIFLIYDNDPNLIQKLREDRIKEKQLEKEKEKQKKLRKKYKK